MLSPTAGPVFVVSAYACAPGFGSERGVGWAWANAYAAVGPTLVISCAHEANGSAVRDAAALPKELSIEQLTTVLDRLPDRHVFVYMKYLMWVLCAQRRIRSLESGGQLRLCHHVTFASDSLPAPKPKDLRRYIWGPVGGSTRTPRSLRGFLDRRSRVTESLKAIVNRTLQQCFLRGVVRNSQLLLAQNADTASSLRKLGAKRVQVFPNAVVTDDFAVDAPTATGKGTREPLDVVFVGRLLDWKGVQIALFALSRCDRAVRFKIYGAGPYEKNLRSLAGTLGISASVSFEGEVSRAEIAAVFRVSDALLFPSFHDACGWAVAEAATSGIPVVCFAAAGPPHVCGDNGVFIDMADPVADLARILRDMADGNHPAPTRPNIDFSARRVELFAREVASSVL